PPRSALFPYTTLFRSLLLLVYTLTVETRIGGVTANRWIKIPLVGVNFQTSTLASVVLMIWIARYLTKIKDVGIRFKESILPLWLDRKSTRLNSSHVKI